MKKVFKQIKKKATAGGRARSGSPGAASNASSAAPEAAAEGAAAAKKQRTGASSASGRKRGSVTSLLSNIGPGTSSRDSKMRQQMLFKLHVINQI